MTEELLYKDEVYSIMGAAMEVHSTLGPGFLEAIYEEAMVIESELRGIPCCVQKEIPVFYKNRRLKKRYKADYVGYSKILVEFKCLLALTSNEEAQILNYLKATQFKVGLLINFASHGNLEWKRFVF